MFLDASTSLRSQVPWRFALAISVVWFVLLGFGASTQAATTTRVSVDSAGHQANGDSSIPPISADGNFIAFDSNASNLVDLDTNGVSDIFLYDRQTPATQRVSVDSAGNQANGESFGPSIGRDGRYVAFRSAAWNLVPGDTNGANDVFVHDHQTGATQRVSVNKLGVQGNGPSFGSSISADGRFVAFLSYATNLIVDETDTNGAVIDVFIYDRQTGTVESAGNQGNGDAEGPSISADGHFVAYRSAASNLVKRDTNGADDIFAYDRLTGATERVSVSGAGKQGNGTSYGASISADGRFVAFRSAASNLVKRDTNGADDVFVHD